MYQGTRGKKPNGVPTRRDQKQRAISMPCPDKSGSKAKSDVPKHSLGTSGKLGYSFVVGGLIRYSESS